MADFFPNATGCGATPPEPIPDGGMLDSDVVPDAPDDILSGNMVADNPLAEPPGCGDITFDGGQDSLVDFVSLANGITEPVSRMTVRRNECCAFDLDVQIVMPKSGGTITNTTIYQNTTVEFDNTTVSFSDDTTVIFDNTDIHFDSAVFDGDLTWNNLTIAVTSNSAINIAFGQTLVFGGEGTVETCAGFSICGDLYMCAADVPVIADDIIDLNVPRTFAGCGRMVIRFVSAPAAFTLHSVNARGSNMVVAFINATGYLMTLKHNSGSAGLGATTIFKLPGLVDMKIKPNGGFIARKFSDHWEVLTEIGRPVTAKGDIWTHDGTEDKALAVGADNSILVAKSSQPNGLQWFTPGGANQILGMNAAGTAMEWKSIVDDRGILVTHEEGVITIENLCCDSDVEDGTITTTCCPDTLIPETLYVTFMDGGCATIIPFVNIPSTSQWTPAGGPVYALGTCSSPYFDLFLQCVGDTWQLIYEDTDNIVYYIFLAWTVGDYSCDPLFLDSDLATTATIAISSCCGGINTTRITVSE